ncbi:hypothetical protein [Streptomyces sp. NPDC002520]
MLDAFKRTETANERRLKAENRDLRNQLAALAERLADLQAANEGHYRAQYDAAGGPRFDRRQTFPSQPKPAPAGWGLKGGEQ